MRAETHERRDSQPRTINKFKRSAGERRKENGERRKEKGERRKENGERKRQMAFACSEIGDEKRDSQLRTSWQDLI